MLCPAEELDEVLGEVLCVEEVEDEPAVLDKEDELDEVVVVVVVAATLPVGS